MIPAWHPNDVDASEKRAEGSPEEAFPFQVATSIQADSAYVLKSDLFVSFGYTVSMRSASEVHLSTKKAALFVGMGRAECKVARLLETNLHL
jgi:hypothetical protein